MPKKGYKHSKETIEKIRKKALEQVNRRGLKKYGLRKCFKCKNIYPLNKDNFFGNNSKGSSGLDWYCKKCHKIKNRKYYNITKLKLRFEIFQRDNFTCQYCGRKTPKTELQIDHIIPESKGGEYIKNNLITSCKDCNLGKGDKLLNK